MPAHRSHNSRTLPWPTDWDAAFGGPRPLLVEIGFGYGQFLLHLARQRPDAGVIGLEVANRCLTAVEQAVARQQLDNVRLVHAPAHTALHHLFAPAALDQVHVNFPDPWFKGRHSHRRLMQRDTLDLIVNRLRPGGSFFLATDIRAYAELSAALLAQTPGLANLLPDAWASALPGRIVTRYEDKARRQGRACYYFACRRTDSPAPPAPPVRELEMPHLVFASPLTLDEMLARFESREHSAGSTHVRFMFAYRGERSLLVETYVKEATIDQHIALMVLARAAPGEYTVQLNTLGQPRPTPGVHRAVALLGAWLVGLDPAARVIKQKLDAEL